MESITEQEVAVLFFTATIKKVDNNWSKIKMEMGEVFKMLKKDIHIENENSAKLSLALALIALELQSLKNTFPDRADRIYQDMIKFIEIQTDLADQMHIKESIEIYQQKFVEYTKLHELVKEYHPLEGVAGELLKNLFDDKVSVFYLDIRNPKTGEGIINPVAAQVISVILTSYLGFWSMVKKSFTITD